MPSEVVAVKRARRRSFALFWAATAWIRAIATSLRRRPASTAAQPAPDSERGRVPALRVGPDGSTRCCASGRCVQSCPSSALAVVGEAGTPKLFRLDPGACIGCGRCLQVCPEDALEWTLAPAALLTNRRGAVAPIDLLEQGRVREAVGG